MSTVPQGVIDMNRCTDVFDAEGTTSHPLSVGIKTPEKSTFIKGTSKDEINRYTHIAPTLPFMILRITESV